MARARKSGSAEDQLIARYFQPLATHPGAFGLVDDAAVLAPPPGAERRAHRGRRSSAGCISLLMIHPPRSRRKRCGLTSPISLPRARRLPASCSRSRCRTAIGEKWLKAFARALGEDARDYGCPLLGGDTVRTPGPVTISIAAFGTVPRGKMLRRSGARAGDRIVVTGTIGDAALGLVLRKDAGGR